MFMQVIFTGDQFFLYDARGNPINDRRILEQISFEQMTTNRSTWFFVNPTNTTSQDMAIMNAVKINISTY
jgi:hypothetical protein